MEEDRCMFCDCVVVDCPNPDNDICRKCWDALGTEFPKPDDAVDVTA